MAKKILFGITIGLICTVVTLAQVVPITKALAWDAALNADDYLVTLDGQTIGITTGLSIPFTITTVGKHTFEVRSRNMWGVSDPASLTVDVSSPGKSGNLRIK